MNNSELAKQLLIESLREDGFGSYAQCLMRLDHFVVADMYDGAPCRTAWMDARHSTMCVNPGFFELRNPDDTEEQKHMMKQLSVIVRHELLHYLLSHEKRFVEYLKKKFPHSWGRKYSDPKMHTLANFAMDWDLGNEAYTEEDKQIVRNLTLNGRVIGGLLAEEDVKYGKTTVRFDDGSVETYSGAQFNHWENKTMEEMWQMLKDGHDVYTKHNPADFGDQTRTAKLTSQPNKKKDGSPAYNAMYDKIVSMFGDGKATIAELEELLGRASGNDDEIDFDSWHFDYSESLKGTNKNGKND